MVDNSTQGKDKGEGVEQEWTDGKNGTETTVYATLKPAYLNITLGSKLMPQQGA